MDDWFAGTQELARFLGVSRQRVHQLARQPGFPAPIARLAMGDLWWGEDVDAWQERRRCERVGEGAPESAVEPWRIPPRDPDHPRDDPWDADALRYLLRTVEGREPGSEVLRFFRTDPGAPGPYPASAAQRRRWLLAKPVSERRSRSNRGRTGPGSP